MISIDLGGLESSTKLVKIVIFDHFRTEVILHLIVLEHQTDEALKFYVPTLMTNEEVFRIFHFHIRTFKTV